MATVPAVVRAVQLMELLVEAETGLPLADLARRAGVPKSSTRNILRTLVDAGALTYDESTTAYDLGPVLVELGTAALGRSRPLQRAIPFMERLSASTDLACLAIQRMPDGHFLTLHKVESRKDIKVTIEIGERFPPDSPLLSRLWDAWAPTPPPAARGRRRYTPATVTEPTAVTRLRDEARARGFGVARGEYIEDVHVVGVPVFGADRRVAMVLALLGLEADLSDARIDELAGLLVATSRELTEQSGGRLPDAEVS